MSNFKMFAEVGLGFGLTFLLCSWLCVWVYRGLLARKQSLTSSPAFDDRTLFLLVSFAPATALAVMLAAYLPGLRDWLIPEHCHDLSCSSHSPHWLSAPVGHIAFVVLFAGIVLTILALISEWVFRHQRVRALSRLSAQPWKNNIYLLDSPLLFAACAGVFRSRVFITRALQQVLDDQQLKVVLAHEQAHARRLDNARKMLFHAFTCLWPGGVKKDVRTQFSLACEHACDRSAARELGPSAVTETLIRLQAHERPPLNENEALNLEIPTRIALLENASPQTRSVFWFLGWIALLTMLTPLLSAFFHFSVESAARLPHLF